MESSHQSNLKLIYELTLDYLDKDSKFQQIVFDTKISSLPTWSRFYVFCVIVYRYYNFNFIENLNMFYLLSNERFITVLSH